MERNFFHALNFDNLCFAFKTKLSLRAFSVSALVILSSLLPVFATDPVALVGSKIAPVDNASVQSAVSGSTVINIVVGLNYRDQTGAETHAKNVSHPGSSSYGQFLTPAQVLTNYGPTSTDLSNVQSFLTTNGLTIDQVGANGLVILAHGTVTQIQTAFGTTIKNYFESTSDAQWQRGYNATSKSFYANSSLLLIPQNISGVVNCVAGLQNYNPVQTRLGHIHQLANNLVCDSSASSQPQSPDQTRITYNEQGLWNSNIQANDLTIAVMSFGQRPDLDTSLYGSIQNYVIANTLPVPGGTANVSSITLSGYPYNLPDFNIETTSDIQTALGMAPKARYLVYDGGDGGTSGAQLAILEQISTDDLVDIVTTSYYSAPTKTEMEELHNIHLALTMQGISVFSASGDNGILLGVYSFLTGYYPNIEPNVLQVGGTIVYTDANSVRRSEYPWGFFQSELNNNYYYDQLGSAGGGYCNTLQVDDCPASPYSFTWNIRPSWQNGPGVPNWINYRFFPDVSLPAASMGTGSSGGHGGDAYKV